MAKTILSDAGYEVTVVSNGAAAYKKIQESPPDVLILDIFMPGYSGLEICEKIRAERATASIPVLLTVGKMEPYRPEDGARVEADGVIVKPFEASDLLTVMLQFESKIAAARARSALKTAVVAPPPPPPDESQWSMAPAEEFGAQEAAPARHVEMSREEGSSAAFGDFFGEHDASSSEAAGGSAAPDSSSHEQTSTPGSMEDVTSGFGSAPVTSPAGETKSGFRPFAREDIDTGATASAPPPPSAAALPSPQPGPNDTQPIYTDFSDPEPQHTPALAIAPDVSALPAARATPPPPSSPHPVEPQRHAEIPASQASTPPPQNIMDGGGWGTPFETPQAEKAAPLPEAAALQGWEPVAAAPISAPAQPQSPAPEAVASPPQPAAEPEPVHKSAAAPPSSTTHPPSGAGAALGQPEESHEEDILDLSEAKPAEFFAPPPPAEVPGDAASPPAHAQASPHSHESPIPAQRPKFASLPLDGAVDIAPEPQPEADEDDILEAQPFSRVHGFAATSASPAAVQSGFAAPVEPGESVASANSGAATGRTMATGADPALIADPSEMANAFPTRFGLDNPEPAVVGLAADAPQSYTQAPQEPASDHSVFEDDILAETDDSPLAAGEQIHLLQGGVHPATTAPADPAQEASSSAAGEIPASAEKISEDTVARLVHNVMEQLRPNLVAEITRQLKEHKPNV